LCCVVTLVGELMSSNWKARVFDFPAELSISFRRRVGDIVRVWRGISDRDSCNMAFPSD
jgi:hypothetical protein